MNIYFYTRWNEGGRSNHVTNQIMWGISPGLKRMVTYFPKQGWIQRERDGLGIFNRKTTR